MSWAEQLIEVVCDQCETKQEVLSQKIVPYKWLVMDEANIRDWPIPSKYDGPLHICPDCFQDIAMIRFKEEYGEWINR